MANYYNVRAWKHTGFDYKNRPYSRDIFGTAYFTNSDNYISMKGIAVNREDMFEITTIDLQGSVKDLRGEQVNSPNVTGSQGTGGPWYSWEEVDYLQLVRTGYPGDEDFVDISGNLTDPWAAPASGGKDVRVGFYFVVGVTPLARNITRLTLSIDSWTTLGASDELEIEAGFKIRGHITDSEDSSTYNTAPEGIGLIEPLTIISSSKREISGNSYHLYASTVNLAQYDPSDELNIEAIAATDPEGNVASIPSISVSNKTMINMRNPDTGSYREGESAPGYGVYNADNTKVKYNVGVLYSLGQFDLNASYTVPRAYVETTVDGLDYIGNIRNSAETIANPTNRDIGSYPRKADYLYGSDAILGTLSGDLSMLPYYDVSDRSIYIWADVSPGGSPLARFKGIKEHPYLFDSLVKGAPWNNYTVVQQGASGSFWNAISLSQSRASQELAKLQSENAYNYEVSKQGLGRATRGDYAWLNAAGVGVSALSGNPIATIASVKHLQNSGQRGQQALYTGQASFSTAANLASGIPVLGDLIGGSEKATKTDVDRYAEIKSQQLEDTNNLISFYKGNISAPSVSFQAGTGVYIYDYNTFMFYTVNTSQNDRTRLKNYFRRYGYSGLYKPLTWANIHVKSKVNYIEAEGALFRHKFYPLRATQELSTLLAGGLFLWDEVPNAKAFEEQGDA